MLFFIQKWLIVFFNFCFCFSIWALLTFERPEAKVQPEDAASASPHSLPKLQSTRKNQKLGECMDTMSCSRALSTPPRPCPTPKTDTGRDLSKGPGSTIRVYVEHTIAGFLVPTVWSWVRRTEKERQTQAPAGHAPLGGIQREDGQRRVWKECAQGRVLVIQV